MSTYSITPALLLLTATLLCSGQQVPQLNEHITQEDGNIESTKKNLELLQQVEALTKENLDLKTQLASKDETVIPLTQEIESLKAQLENKSQMVDTLNQENSDLRDQLNISKEVVMKLHKHEVELVTRALESEDKVHNLGMDLLRKTHENQGNQLKVQDLERDLEEVQRQVEQLKNIVLQLNQTTEIQQNSTASSQECSQPHLQEIKPLVRRFNSNDDWGQLRTSLQLVLDAGSEVYKQLQSTWNTNSWHMYNIGKFGHTELAALLLCAGMPVDTKDEDADTMLHGAAFAGQIDLVRFLLDHGAKVDELGANGSTALMRAADGEHLELIKFLVQRGANTTAENLDGSNAMAHAEDPAVIQYLQQFPH